VREIEKGGKREGRKGKKGGREGKRGRERERAVSVTSISPV